MVFGCSNSRGRANRTGLRFLCATIAIACLAAGVAGCGGSSDPSSSRPTSSPSATPTATATPGPQPGAFFSPLAPPISPNTVWHSAVTSTQGQEAAAASPTATPVFDRYFYLVNGILSDGSPLPTGPGTSSLPSAPLVLTVTGAAPYGATAPNGATTVSLQAYSPSSGGSQMWKAVAGPTAGSLYLRSAESFAVSQVNQYAPSLIGPGAPGMALDLGFGGPLNLQAAIYSNQQNSPSGDNSGFQQWSYDPATAQITNLSANGQLYNSSGGVGVASQAPAPGNQWYAYPSYFVGTIVDEPNSNPPFPAAADAGQAAAYEYISNLPGLDVGGVGCNYEGTAYTGIRCEYTIVTTSKALTNCFSAVSSATPPSSYNGTPISPADWSAVASQIENECSDAVAVQNLFDYYNQIFDFVFINAGDQVANLLTDVKLSSNQSLTVAAPLELVEGVLYTLLNVSKNTGAGVVANLMAAAVNTALAVPQNTLNDKLSTTAGALYGALSTSFQQVNAGALSAENAILQDWGRLQQIGAATNIVGYNGLGLNSNDVGGLENQTLSAYELMIMEQLMPVAYNPWITFASKGAPTGLNTSNYNNFSYATFGSNTQNNNSSTFLKNPSLKVMQTDIFDNGADPFEVFNALNGWSSFKVDINQGDSQYCRMITIALFNATPNFFTINIAPSKGLIAFPGCNQVTCTQGWGGAELRPYGYLTLYAQSNGSKLEDTVDIYSGATLAGSLTVQGDSFCSNGGNLSGSIKPAAGFSFTQLGVLNPRHSGDGGVWTTIYQ